MGIADAAGGDGGVRVHRRGRGHLGYDVVSRVVHRRLRGDELGGRDWLRGERGGFGVRRCLADAVEHVLEVGDGVVALRGVGLEFLHEPHAFLGFGPFLHGDDRVHLFVGERGGLGDCVRDGGVGGPGMAVGSVGVTAGQGGGGDDRAAAVGARADDGDGPVVWGGGGKLDCGFY